MLTQKCRTKRSALQRLNPHIAALPRLSVAVMQAKVAAIDMVAAPDLPGCVEPSFSEASRR